MDRLLAPPALPERPLRGLMAYRSDVDGGGGAARVMQETAEALRDLGVEVDVTFDEEPDADGYEVVQAVNIWAPASALRQLEHLRRHAVPVCWEPFYLHWCEYAWARLAMAVVGQPDRSASERAGLFDAMAAGTLQVNGLSRWAPNEVAPGLHAHIAEMAALVDHVSACSVREIQMLSQTAGLAAMPFTLAPHGVHAATFAGADPAPFRELVGPEPFALCVGSVDGRKNQALLAHALAGHELRLVLVGPSYEPDTVRMVRELGDERLVWLERLPHELVASAVNAAAVHVLPSYAEGSALASMEAAAAGCPIVVSNRSSEFEYYGDLATYCDPADAGSVRRAVDLAARHRAEEPERLAQLAEHMRGLSWAHTAERTAAAWRRTVAAGRRRARATAGIADARTRLVLADAEELCADPALLAAYAAAVSSDHDVTLVIAAPEAEAEAAFARLGAVVAQAGLEDPASPDMLALPVSATQRPALARAADALLTRRAPAGALAHLPRVALEPPAPLAAAA